MRDVRLNGKNKSIIAITIEKPHLDLVLPPQHGGSQAVHSIDNTHRRTIHNDRRQCHFRVGKRSNMLDVLTGQSRRVRRPQGVDRHCHDSGLILRRLSELVAPFP